ncbi:zinc finger protein 816 [Patella vulgata]|uniref:zinc finger protein 816 n=1 Tax=Patella vulgata TaxID=6465 RepID=UPI0024A8C5AF|nr:zinc finger protein 816 [Patella vulgata]
MSNNSSTPASLQQDQEIPFNTVSNITSTGNTLPGTSVKDACDLQPTTDTNSHLIKDNNKIMLQQKTDILPHSNEEFMLNESSGQMEPRPVVSATIQNVHLTDCNTTQLNSDSNLDEETDVVTVPQASDLKADSTLVDSIEQIKTGTGVENQPEYILAKSIRNKKSGYEQILNLCEKNFPSNIQLIQDLLNLNQNLSEDGEIQENFSNICNRLISEMLHLNHTISEICKNSMTSQQANTQSGPFEALLNVWKKNMIQRRKTGKLSFEDEEMMNMAALQHDSTYDNIVPNLDIHFSNQSSVNDISSGKKSEGSFLDIKSEWLKRFSGTSSRNKSNPQKSSQSDDSAYTPSRRDGSKDTNKSPSAVSERSLRSCRSKSRVYKDSLNLSDIDQTSEEEDCDLPSESKSDLDDEDFVPFKENSQLSCEVCEKVFKTQRLLVLHKRIHHKIPEFTCDVCNRSFNSNNGLQQHIAFHVRSSKSSKPIPHSSVSQSQTTKPSSTSQSATQKTSPQRPSVSEEIYTCETCGLSFRRKFRYSLHMRSHDITRPFKCPTCPKMFRTETSLNKHNVLSHSANQRYECTECDKTFKNETSLKYHQMCHSGNLPYACSQCDKKFVTISVRDKHELTHSDEKPYPCTLCDKKFKTPYSLKKHNLLHLPEKNFQCDFCGQQFRQKSTLTSHHRTHTGEKPYVCDTCGKAFSQSSILNMHKRIHTGYKPHKCTLCESAFSCRASLRKHMTIHTGEKNYMCKECGRCFARSQSLKYHERSHTGIKPYLCKECGKRFSCRKHVKRHRLLHSGEMPFSCEVCGKMFRQEYNKKIHMRVHTGDKPFDCKNCGRCFAYKQSAQQHTVHCLKQVQKPTFVPYNVQQNFNFQQL